MPATLATCEVYGTIHDVFAQPVQGAVVGVMAVYKQGALVLSRTREVETDVDGYFTLELPRGPECVAILYANTPGLNISALGTPTAIPDADSAELTSIIGDFNLWDQVPVAIPIGAGVSSFNGRRGDVVLLSSDVTGALGYTPADAAALADYVPLAGGVMAGFLTLSGNPLSTFHAATKNYVDQEILDAVASIPPSGVSSVNGRTGDVVLTGADVSSALGYTPVNKAGDTMLGALVLSADPLVNLEAATKHYVDIQIAAGGVNTTADYYWTGKHEFAGPSPAVRANTINSRVGGFLSFTSDTTVAINATTASGNMQFNGPSGSSFRIDSASAKIAHANQIILNLASFPAGGGSIVLQAFDNSFIQRAHYYMTDSGRHFFNAPSIVDTGNSAVTIYADDTHGSVYANALRLNGASLLNGSATLGAGAALNITFASGYVVQVLRQDASGFYYTGPVAADGGGASGLYVLHCCGTGAYEGAPGTVNQHGPNATWYYSAHINQGAGYTLTLGQDPTAALHAATKAYVDAHAGGGGALDLAANYNWTGQHSWTQPLTGTGQFKIQQTGDQYGATSLTLNNRDANIGVVLKNSGLDVVDFNAEGVSGLRHLIRFEFRGGVGTWISMACAGGGGEFRIAQTYVYANLDLLLGAGRGATLGRDPTAALEAATKQYCDANAAGVNLAADYAWTGNHTWNKSIKVYTPVNGQGMYIQSLGAGNSPTLTLNDDTGTGVAAFGAARSAGSFLPMAVAGDAMLMNYAGSTYINFQNQAAFVFGTYGANNTPVTIGYNSLTANNYLCVGVPWVGTNNARVMVQTTGMPEFALAFTNAVNASVNFQTQAAGASVSGNASGKGASYITVYGDLSIARYVDQTTVQHWLYCRDIDTPPCFSTYCFGQAASPGYFFVCTVDGTTPLLAVHTNGDVTLAHDPTSALHAVTKQYSDSKLAKSGGTLTGPLTLNADPVNPLDAATKQYADTKLAKAGGTMTGLLTLSANPSGVLDAAPKQYVDLRLLKAGDTMTGALTLSNVSIIQNSAALGALTVGVSEELLTLATGALTTDTAGNLLPANSIILSVTGRITTAINNITNWKLGDATIADRFTAVSTTLTAGTTVVGLNMWDASRVTAGMGQIQAAAAKVRVTVTGTQNTTGAIRITTRYLTVAASTS